mgnify:CR=1 FL=1
MHPNRKEGVAGHNAKLRKYTEDYGAADPKMYKTAPVDRLKKNGPEDAVGYGAEDGTAIARGDRPARKSSAANPIATYKSGGRVRKRQDGGVMNLLRNELGAGAITDREQRELVDRVGTDKANEHARALADRIGNNPTVRAGRALREMQTRGRADGGRLEGEMGAPGGMLGRSSGRSRKGASTNVNIIVAPQAAPPAQPPMLPLPAGGLPPGMGPGGPGAGAGGPPGGPGGPGPLAGLGGPGGLPPGATPPGLPQLPRKRGGRVHPDEAEDKTLVKQMVKPSALKRAAGGRMTAGAESGPGRLEKTANRARRQSGDKSAEC